jgi:pyruvate formate lyase activating enzyme
MPFNCKRNAIMLSQNYPTKYWHELENSRIQCDLCPQACKLNEGQRGICYVRMRQNDQIVLTTYGRSSGFCVDPIEKKPLNHFLSGSTVYSFGTIGCNLLCKFCQNWDISKAREDDGLAVNIMPQNIGKTAKEQQCRSVAFTYNEPIIFMEYAVDVAKVCRQLDIRTVAVTNGYVCDEPRKELFAYMDAVRVDLKGFTDKFYKNITGSHLQPVLDTLIYLKQRTNIWLEVVCLLIPGENDSATEIEDATKWLVENLGVDVPVHFTAFHPAWKMLDKPVTPLHTLIRARDIAMKNGMRYVYTGNVYHLEGNKTFCHNCKKCVIARVDYTIAEYKLNELGSCKFCGAKCAGVFN